jgi:hypothetical protein
MPIHWLPNLQKLPLILPPQQRADSARHSDRALSDAVPISAGQVEPAIRGDLGLRAWRRGAADQGTSVGLAATLAAARRSGASPPLSPAFCGGLAGPPCNEGNAWSPD